MDKKLFSFPLTLVVQRKVGEVLTAKQKGKKLQIVHLPTKVLIDFDPHDGDLIIQGVRSDS